MSIRFDQTGRGARFFDAQVPRALDLLERLVTELSRLNANLERAPGANSRAGSDRPPASGKSNGS